MEGIIDFLVRLLDYSDFNPRNTCGMGWNSGLMWLHVISDCLIWLSYLAIPCVLIYFVRKRRDAPFPHLFWLFGAFILSCGTTHLVGMFMFTFPAYRLDALIKLITAAVSMATVVALIPVTPRFLAMRSPRELEAEIAERKLAEEALRLSRLELERRVEERTAELNEANKKLQAEIAHHKAMEKTLQETEARKTAMLESALDCVISMDYEGKIVEFNPAAEKTFGVVRSDVMGKALASIIIPPSLREQHTQGLTRYLETGKGTVIGQRLEFPAMRADGSEFLAEISITAIRWSGPPLFTGFLRDITERKRTEKKIKQHAAELARSNADLEQFAYVASHDMQEPIRMVVSYMQLLESRYKGKLDSKADQYIHYAVDGAKRMQDMIKGLLNFARAGKANESYQPIDTNSALETALRNLRQSIDDTQAKITFDQLPTVMGETTQLIQLFQNLIGNALKFRGEDTPTIHLSVTPVDGVWQFSVRDNGIGIDPRSQYRVFQIFQRLHEREKYPGSGIGLAICKKIVDRLGGRIWVDSEPEKGSTFHFTIPQSLSQEAKHLKGPEPTI